MKIIKNKNKKGEKNGENKEEKNNNENDKKKKNQKKVFPYLLTSNKTVK